MLGNVSTESRKYIVVPIPRSSREFIAHAFKIMHLGRAESNPYIEQHK
jgi:hypothetical protein